MILIILETFWAYNGMCIALNIQVIVDDIIRVRKVLWNWKSVSLHTAPGHKLHSTRDFFFSAGIDKFIISLTMCSENRKNLHNLDYKPEREANPTHLPLHPNTKFWADLRVREPAFLLTFPKIFTLERPKTCHDCFLFWQELTVRPLQKQSPCFSAFLSHLSLRWDVYHCGNPAAAWRVVLVKVYNS